jgi:hypothetical protein
MVGTKSSRAANRMNGRGGGCEAVDSGRRSGLSGLSGRSGRSGRSGCARASMQNMYMVATPRFNLCAFAALREILSLGFRAREAVGAPGLGSDAVVYEEKAGGIVFFFDGF